MASSGNFCTFNPLVRRASSYTDLGLSHSNLRLTYKIGNGSMGNFGFKLGDGKFYFEIYIIRQNSAVGIGIMKSGVDMNNYTTQGPVAVYRQEGRSNVSANSGTGAPTQNASYGENMVADDIVGCAVDFTNSTINWYRNNSAQGEIDISGMNDGTEYFPIIYGSNSDIHINFGQDSTFAGLTSAGGNADANGFGDFKYSPPTGFLALCTANLPISDDIDPAQTDDNYPTKNFGIVKYTGTGSSQAITGLGFKPDLIWIKQRNGSGHNVLTDSTRGVTKQLEITDTEGGAQPAESTNTDGVTAFGTDGFTVGGDAAYSGNTNTYVAWCWRAGGGTTSTNTDGTVASTVQANQAAGFSIVSYTGTGTAMTIGHGLSAAPNFTIIKDRSNAANWIAFYDVEDGSLDYMFPNAYTGKANSSLTGPNSSIWNFSGSDSYSNTSSRNYIMYAWHNVEGYQKFGTYEGNNTDNNGPFVYTGFRPRLLVLKGIDESYGWYVFDSERSISNLVDDNISWFPGGAETSEPTGARKVDFLSNGFRVMADAASINGNNDTYLYMCWGDVPFKYNNAF